MKEKKIETEIYNYLKGLGCWVEKMQGGKILVKKAGYQHMMILQSPGTPDIIALHKGVFYGIEVKKNPKELNEWLKIEERYNGTGKPLPLSKSYEREKNQIEHKNKIIENSGVHLLTDSLADVKDFFKEL